MNRRMYNLCIQIYVHYIENSILVFKKIFSLDFEKKSYVVQVGIKLLLLLLQSPQHKVCLHTGLGLIILFVFKIESLD